jgi:hypothetical protein
MKTYSFKIRGISPLCYGKYHNLPALEKEIPADYEKRTWMEKAHSKEAQRNQHAQVPILERS